MDESIDALEAAVGELIAAHDVLPDELAAQLEEIVAQARALIASLRERGGSDDAPVEVG